jgi:hypothetical protein
MSAPFQKKTLEHEVTNMNIKDAATSSTALAPVAERNPYLERADDILGSRTEGINMRLRVGRGISAPSDRAAKVRAEAERLFVQTFVSFFDHLEDIVREQLAEAEADIRSEYQD